MVKLLTPCTDQGEIRTIVCGQSHVASLVQAIVAADIDGAPSPGPELALRLGIAGLSGWNQMSADRLTDETIALVENRHFALVWKGNQHNRDFLFAPEPLLDFVMAAEPLGPIEDASIIVPEAAIREHLRPSIDSLEEVLKSVPGRPGCRRFVLGTPAPLHDGELIRGRLAQYREKMHAGNAMRVQAAEGALETLAIMPASIRRKLWLTLQSLLAEAAARHGAEFIPVPAKSLDRHGCLDPRYSIGDISHTTVAYGLLLLQDLAARLSSSPQEAMHHG